MSEHAWAEENVAAYLAGGLGALEAERLEAHARECPACAAALAAARRLDRGMSALFAGVRPGAELEDRAVARLRTASPRQWSLSLRWPARVAAAVAALLILGAFGALASSIAESGLPMPGSPKRVAKATRALLSGTDDSRSMTAKNELTNEDGGLQSNLEAALPDIDRVSKQMVDSAVTFDNLGQPNAPNTDTTALALPGLSTNDFAAFGYFPGRNGYTADRARSMKGFDIIGPQFDPIAKPDGKFHTATAANGYYSSAFKPGEFKMAGVVPQQPDPKKDDPKAPPKVDPPDNTKPPEPDPQPMRRVVLRSGNMEFEVPAFDPASATVTKLVNNIKGAFVATINSEKLPNGKVKGSITVRVPPEHLDGLVLDLRKELGATGELKGVKLTSQDVSKQYTDLESRLRAARTMETRLLQIIKEGKGEIKLLLEAERELGVWRTKIEEFEGELRYYSNLAALSTLTISLTEKEIRAAAGLTENERVQTGVEVEDVDKAYQELLKAITEAKGRILKSEVKQLTAGQFNASLQFEVAPEAAGPMRDRLKMLGRVARLEIDRVTQAEGGTLPTDAKTKRGDTVFLVQLYNLANVAPRETATLQVAAVDVPAAYQSLRDAVAKAAGRVLNAQLNEQDRTNVSAQLDFEVRRSEEGTIRTALDAAGEVVSRQVARAAEGENVTDAKVLYKATLLAAHRLKPREVTTLAVEVADVDGAAAVFAAQVAEAKGRQADAQFARDRGGRVTAKLVFEVPLSAAAGLVERFKAAGTVRVSQSVRDPQATEGRFATARIDVTLTSAEQIVAEGEGLWPQVRRGLSYSASVLLTSVTWVVFGLCVVLPWAVIAFVAYRLVRRWFFPRTATPPPAPPVTA